MPHRDIQQFEHVLRHRISLSDNEWNFSVPGMPCAAATNPEGLIKAVFVTTNVEGRYHSITFKFMRADLSRATGSSPLDKHILISFAKFKSLNATAAPESCVATHLPPLSAREVSAYIIKLLRKGIHVENVHYNFYGHSNSQLKSRTCFLYAAGKDDISKKVDAYGDFTNLTTVSKKVKRIGLLFSVARVAMSVDPEKVEDIPDIESDGHLFTDGCGLIAAKFAQDLSRRLRLSFRNVRYTPSVFQVRYRGYKGVVTVDPTMAKTGPWLKMRNSMKKFKGGVDMSFSVVDYSKPYTFGFLNDEIVILLDALGVDRAVLIRKQQEHLDFLHKATRDPQAAFRLACQLNRLDLAEKVVLDSLEAVQPAISKLVHTEYDKMLSKRDEQRCRILIPRSRLLFGVCDAWGVLEPGQCAVKVTMDGDGQPYALKGAKVLVTRNPCLHPGDIQKLDVVERQELAHLHDCIVFPTTGPRPSADMMSGGDLDGDTFFVSWDVDIIPSTIAQAAEYPAVRQPMRFNPITDDDRLLYFARYSNASLGRVKNKYLQWARCKGAMSPECQELNRLFSQCVDGNRINDTLLNKFDNLPDIESRPSPFVLDDLHERATKTIVARQTMSEACGDGTTLDGIELMFNRMDLAISEIELTKLALRWCKQTKTPFSELLHVIDFNALTAVEKTWLLSQCPLDPGVPSLVMNALCTSSLISREYLRHMKLDNADMHWKRVYTSDLERLETFLEATSRYLELYDKTLVVFRPDDRLTVAMYVPRKITKSDDCLVDNRVKMLAITHTQGRASHDRLLRCTKRGYRLFCDENTLQLFEGKRANTWLFIGRDATNISGHHSKTRDRRQREARSTALESGVNFDFRVSIALDKFGKDLQNQVGRLHRQGISAAEIYIISNRDTRSMRALDLWGEYIDNEQQLPLFEQTPKEWDVPRLSDVDWAAESRLVTEVVRNRNFTAVLDTTEIGKLRQLFQRLYEKQLRDILVRCYEQLAKNKLRVGHSDATATLQLMLEFSKKMPSMSVVFADVGPWKSLGVHMETTLQDNATTILRNIILSASEYGDLIVAPFQRVIETTDWFSLSDLCQLIELVSLTVHSQETAIDILLGVLDRHSSRLLTGRPAANQHAVRCMIGIALEHIGEVCEKTTTRDELLNISLSTHLSVHHWGTVVEVPMRLDTMEELPVTNTHVRLIAASPPTSCLTGKAYSMDGLVVQSRPGMVSILCYHAVPSFHRDCHWRLQVCARFVTSKAMFEAVTKLHMEQTSCSLLDQIVGSQRGQVQAAAALPQLTESSLNESQQAAVCAAVSTDLLCLWGPPGTGKTHTIVSIIRELQNHNNGHRFLITAPTHNAVDNVMRRYLIAIGSEDLDRAPELVPLRVSTEVRKVADDLRQHTCDGLAGEEVYTGPDALRIAKDRVSNARIVFSTCVGSSLGLLRKEHFNIVIIDEASQQTESASLIPLAKGCTKAILVGDHVQLRPTVHAMSLAVEFDVSLFERLYTRRGQTSGMSKIMLDVQYRMHTSICDYSSREFYDGHLRSAAGVDERCLPMSAFPWPASDLSHSRMTFVECSAKEDIGNKSKANKGQADMCLLVCKMLLKQAPIKELRAEGTVATPLRNACRPSIVILTPYSRQVQLLKQLLHSQSSAVEVFSIDGFQGREADIVVFVSVRCNERGDTGFLRDTRRMNVALTRAKLGLVLIGNERTLTCGSEEEVSAGMWKRLLQSSYKIDAEAIPNFKGRTQK